MTASVAPPRAPAPPPDPRRTPARSSGWFRAVWRWHFFASFLVVPILLLLATTGLIYLFRFQLEPLLHPGLYDVDTQASGGIAQPYVSQLAVVEQAYPGSTSVSLAEPRRPRRSRRSCRSRPPTEPAATCSSTRTGSRCWARSTRTRRCPAGRSGCTAS